jgi:hypothetical protein
MTPTTIRLAIACLVLACVPVIAIPNSELSQIKTCVAIGGTRGQASPPKTISVVGAAKGYYLLRIGDRAGNPPYERIIKLSPCRTVFIDQAGDAPSKYGIAGMSDALIDSLVLQSVQFDIRAQGKEKFFRRIASSAKDGTLYIPPDVYKALKKEGFTTKARVILFDPK